MLRLLEILSFAVLMAHAAAACDRAMLQSATAAYIKAQTAGKPSLLPLAKNVTYMENDAVIELGQGVMSRPVKIDFNRSLHDTTQCASFTELSAATNSHPYVIDTRLLFSGDKIASIQTVVADAGDWIFNATSQLSWTKKEKWDTIPEDKRDTREVIQAAGDAYLDSWKDPKVKVPYGTPCARLEGGSYTATDGDTRNTCTMGGFPQPFLGCNNRRYIIDEEVGGLDIFNSFPFIDVAKPNGTSSMNLFRIEQGMIRYIHETTICSEKDCGR